MKVLPRGSTQFNTSPGFRRPNWRVPSPIIATNIHNSLASRSTKLMEMGRRRKVDGEPSTRTSTNCPGNMSGSGFVSVNLISTCFGLIASTERTFKSSIYFIQGAKIRIREENAKFKTPLFFCRHKSFVGLVVIIDPYLCHLSRLFVNYFYFFANNILTCRFYTMLISG